MQEDSKEVDVHRIITTSFNVELNPFIAKFEPKRGYFETYRTGGIMEIRVRNEKDIFCIYAYKLKDFREEIFSKSVKWKFPIYSFIDELNQIIKLYSEILSLTYRQAFSREENAILDNMLIEPLKNFLYTLDSEFSTDHFFRKIGHLKRVYNKRHFQLRVRVVDELANPCKNEKVTIHDIDNIQSNQLVDTLVTDSIGFCESKLAEGSYETRIEKYKLKAECELNRNSTLLLTKPSLMLTVYVVEVNGETKIPRRKVSIKIYSIDIHNTNLKTLFLKSDINGYAKAKIPFGEYSIELGKYKQTKTCKLDKNRDIEFIVPKRHWWNIFFE